MSAAVSIEISDLDAVEAALDNIGPLHDLLGLGGAGKVGSTAPSSTNLQAIIQTRTTRSSVSCMVITSSDNYLNYPIPSQPARVISTLANESLKRHYCSHVHIAEAFFGHTQGDWYSRLNTILVNLGRLQPGWWGADSKPPRISACRDLERVGAYLPARTNQPEVEVDESTGSISLIWSQQNPTASVTLVFTGEGAVIGIVMGHSFKARWKHPISDDRAILNALSAATAKVVLFSQ